MEERIKNTKINDLGRVSRNLAALGVSSLSQLQSYKVLLIGLDGLGVEIARNLILLGINTLQIYSNLSEQENHNYYHSMQQKKTKQLDEQQKQLDDEEEEEEYKDASKKQQFHSSYLHIQSTNIDEFQFHLQKLNPKLNLSIIEKNSSQIQNEISQSQNTIFKQNQFNIIICSTIIPYNLAQLIDEKCRKSNIGFIYTASYGLTGFIFIDFGENFICNQQDYSELHKSKILSITDEEQNENNQNQNILVIETEEKHSVRNKKEIMIKDVVGLEALNNKNFQIEQLGPNSFKINTGETKLSSSNYKNGGTVYRLQNQKINYNFQSLETLFGEIQSNKSQQNFQIQSNQNNQLPKDEYKKLYDTKTKLYHMWISNGITSEGGIDQLMNQIKNQNDQDTLFKKQLSLFSRNFRCQYPTMCSYIGALVANESIKFTGKNIPINQLVAFDFYSQIFSDFQDTSSHQILPSSIINQLQNLKPLVIGAGAMGSEILKQFLSLNVGSAANSQITIIDDDFIESSNLSRQFLFHPQDIGKNKATTVKENAQHYNKKCNIKDIPLKFSPENENIFNEDLLNDCSFLISAVDSIQARQYIDQQAFNFSKPMFEGGTGPFEANCLLILPNVTERFQESKEILEEDNQKSQENGLEQAFNCTERGLPRNEQDLIIKAKSLFYNKFINPVKIIKQFLENGKIDVANDNSTYERQIQELFYFLYLINNNNQNSEEIILSSFQEYFKSQVQAILRDRPLDLVINGKKFWSGNRILPIELIFDQNNPDHQMFQKAIQQIYQETLIQKNQLIFESENNCQQNQKNCEQLQNSQETITQDQNEQAKQQITKLNLPEMLDSIKTNKWYSLLEETLIFTRENRNAIKSFNQLTMDLENAYGEENKQMMQFIEICTKLWSQCFHLKQISNLDIRMKYKTITPALISTTSAIVSLMCFEIMKLLLYKGKGDDFHEKLQNYNLDLKGQTFLSYKLTKKLIYKKEQKENQIIHRQPEHDSWLKIFIFQQFTLKQFIAYIKETYSDVKEISSIRHIRSRTDKSTFYVDLPYYTDDQQLLEMKLEDIAIQKYNKNPNFTFLTLEVVAENFVGCEIWFAPILYYFNLIN